MATVNPMLQYLKFCKYLISKICIINFCLSINLYKVKQPLILMKKKKFIYLKIQLCEILWKENFLSNTNNYFCENKFD